MIDKLDDRLKKALIGLLVELVEAAVEEVTSGQKSQETLDTERTGDTSPPLELPDSWASSAAPAESLVSEVPFSADVQPSQPPVAAPQELPSRVEVEPDDTVVQAEPPRQPVPVAAVQLEIPESQPFVETPAPERATVAPAESVPQIDIQPPDSSHFVTPEVVLPEPAPVSQDVATQFVLPPQVDVAEPVAVEQPSAVPPVETPIPDQSPESSRPVTPEVVLPEPAEGGVMGPPRQVPQEPLPVSQEVAPLLVLPPQLDVSPVQGDETVSAVMEVAPLQLVLPPQMDMVPVQGDETASAVMEAAPLQLVLPPQIDMAEPVAVEQVPETPQQLATEVLIEPSVSSESILPPKLRLPEEIDVVEPPRQVPQESVPVSQEAAPSQLALPPQLVLQPQMDVLPVQGDETVSAGMEAAPPQLVLPPQMDMEEPVAVETATETPQQTVVPVEPPASSEPVVPVEPPASSEPVVPPPETPQQTVVPVEPPASSEPVVTPKLRLPEEVPAPTPDYIAEEEDDRRSRYEEQSDNARDSMYRLEDTMYSLLNDLTRHLNNLNDIVRGASDRIRIIDAVQMRDRREGT